MKSLKLTKGALRLHPVGADEAAENCCHQWIPGKVACPLDMFRKGGCQDNNPIVNCSFSRTTKSIIRGLTRGFEF